MKPSETTAVYLEACKSRRIHPQEEEGRLWHRILSHYDLKDVQAALDLWAANGTPGKDGEARGKWMPAPAELKPLVEAIVHEREVRAAIKRYRVRWRCEACRFTMIGFLAVGEPSSRACPSVSAPNGLPLPAGLTCGAPLTVQHDERPRA